MQQTIPMCWFIERKLELKNIFATEAPFSRRIHSISDFCLTQFNVGQSTNTKRMFKKNSPWKKVNCDFNKTNCKAHCLQFTVYNFTKISTDGAQANGKHFKSDDFVYWFAPAATCPNTVENISNDKRFGTELWRSNAIC